VLSSFSVAPDGPMRAEIRIHIHLGTLITTVNMNTVYVSEDAGQVHPTHHRRENGFLPRPRRIGAALPLPGGVTRWAAYLDTVYPGSPVRRFIGKSILD
jgi:hypothetical protein